jgi:putative transposase
MDANQRTSGVAEPRYWGMPDALWVQIEPLLPPRKPHPLGCHRPRVADHKAMDAIFFVLRTGCQWNALPKETYGSGKTAHCYFQRWVSRLAL